MASVTDRARACGSAPLVRDDVYRALGSPQRREILRLLGESAEPGKTCCAADELCACKLTDALGLASSTISHHMTVLIEAGLVTARRDGVWVYYSLCRDVLRQAAEEILLF